MFVSVCICTWNRAELLDQTLTAMHALRIPQGVEWELLVVNNNCTDPTDEVIARHTGYLPIRRLFEVNQGHSQARNCAVNAARGELVLWTDDDVTVDHEWLAAYVDAAQQWPQALFFGGTVDPWFAVDPPEWIRCNLDLLIGPFAIAQLGSSVRPLASDETVTGANMAFRSKVYDSERYDPSLGRVAQSLTSGDDTEFARRLRTEGALGVWVGPARVRHYIPPERLAKGYIRRWFHGCGVTHARIEGVYSGARLLGMPRWAIRAYVQSIPGSLLFAASGGKYGFRSFKKTMEYGGFLVESRRLSHQPARTDATSTMAIDRDGPQ
jgi:glycosyltransferase involved in cell wall biosynthesis